MSSNYTNTGCPLQLRLPEDPEKLWSGGELHFRASQVGWLVSGACMMVALITSAWLIDKHLRFFYAPHTQRHIVRILFLVPLYAICSFLSYYFVHSALYFQLARDCYEAIVLSAFFSLLLAYLSSPVPTAQEPCPAPYATRAERAARLREVVKDVHIKKWVWPLGRLKWRSAGGGKGEGEAFVWLMRICIGQYVIVRPLSTAVAVVSEALDMYCLVSWSPGFTHVWTALAITISVTVAMYAIVQLYVPFKKELGLFSPILLQMIAIKGVIFFTFWQETTLSFLASPLDLIEDAKYWTAHEQVIGISAILSCFEMMCFAFLHVKAFSYLPYRALAKPVKVPREVDSDSLSSVDSDPMPKSFAAWSAWEERKAKERKVAARLAKMKIKAGHHLKQDGSPILQQTKRWPSLLKCLIVTDIGRELKEETVYLARRGKGDKLLERQDELEEVMGKARMKPTSAPDEKDWSREGDEEELGTVEDLEKDLRRLKQGKSRGGSKVAADGSLVVLTKYQGEGAEADSLLRAEEGRSPREWEAGKHENRATRGWWNSLTGRASKSDDQQAFTQLKHTTALSADDLLDPTTAPRPPPRIFPHAPSSSAAAPSPSSGPRRLSAPPRPSHLAMPAPLATSELPLDSMAYMGPVLPPHVLEGARRPSRNSRRQSAGTARTADFFVAGSTVERPAMAQEETRSERSLVVATEASKRSAGLPPGAGLPRAARPSSFLIEEY